MKNKNKKGPVIGTHKEIMDNYKKMLKDTNIELPIKYKCHICKKEYIGECIDGDVYFKNEDYNDFGDIYYCKKCVAECKKSANKHSFLYEIFDRLLKLDEDE